MHTRRWDEVFRMCAYQYCNRPIHVMCQTHTYVVTVSFRPTCASDCINAIPAGEQSELTAGLFYVQRKTQLRPDRFRVACATHPHQQLAICLNYREVYYYIRSPHMSNHVPAVHWNGVVRMAYVIIRLASLSSSPLSASISPSLFHSRLKTYLFNKSFPP